MKGADWSVDEILPRLTPSFGKSAVEPIGEDRVQAIADHEVTDAMLRESLGIMAEVVTLYGDAYLPIFERLHRELETRRQRAVLLEEAFRLSRQP